jgi:DNA replication protein DnaC
MSELEEFDPVAVVARIRESAGELLQTHVDVGPRSIESASRADDILRGWGVPERIRHRLRDGVHQTKALDWVHTWTERADRPWCLVLSSSTGVGKSTAAGAWLRELAGSVECIVSQPVRRWWPATELAALDFYGDQFPRICDCTALVVDDLGVEYNDVRGAFVSKFDRLLDARYRELRRTIVTTNLTAAAFAERYEERIRDRLREGAIWASISGQSLRGNP